MSLYLPLFKALNDTDVKYVVVGGSQQCCMATLV